MIQLHIANADELHRTIGDVWPTLIQRGLSSGVQKATEDNAEAMRNTAHVKSGKARSSISAKMLSPLTGAAAYDGKDAWYIGFVEWGTKAHLIFAKGRIGGKESKRLSRYARRHISSTRNTINWKDELSANPQWSGLRSSRSKKKNLRFTVGGGDLFRAFVMHPGIRKSLAIQWLASSRAETSALTVSSVVAETLTAAGGK